MKKFLFAILMLGQLAAAEVVSKEDIACLTELAQAVSAASRVEVGAKASKWTNQLGFAYFAPGGMDCYPSFWIRDFVMSVECGVISRETAHRAFECIAKFQAKREIALPSGARIPSGSIPDHIRPDGVAVFFPGTYEPEKSGGKVWGFRPAMDDNYFFIHLAGYLQDVDMAEYADALEAAFHAVSCDADGVAECGEENRGVAFGFSDSVFQTGKLLWPTLLKARAARDLSQLFARAGNRKKSQDYATICTQLKRKIEEVFSHESGLLLSATEICRQPDVWGSAYALYYDLVSEETATTISDALAKFYREGAISCEGQICHVPRPYFASCASCWEKTSCRIAVNVYQNGSYWATPTGWVVYAIAYRHPDDGKKLFGEYIQHVRKFDFRLKGNGGAPWECIYPADAYFQNAVYLTSVACPLAAAQRLARESK
ncbi:MAG: hypothetical protein MJ016_04805 [Victivallaceae bacterium]|nr:hypothetical protein [Victivallaceae bacterium]